jgi:tetratricopeptide (TPR) repeat protein
MPDGVFSGYGQGWDVYSFGVVAYRILTGRLPRADAAWNAQVERARRQVEVGLAYQIDSMGLLQAVRSEPEVQWPGAAADKWEERRRGIIERALSLNAAERWRDMREVMREFEVLESDFLLEQSRAETVAERLKQKKLVSGLRLKVAVLGLSLLAALGYGVITWMRAVGVETELAESEARHLEDVEQREARAAAEVAKREASLSELTLQRDSGLTAKATSDSNLRHAQAAVDQFLTQLLQTPVSNDLEVEFSRKQLDDALEFTKHSLEDLEGQPELGVERARAYGNLGRIYLRLKQEEPAREYLQKAIDEAVPLLAANQEPKMALTLHQMIGRYGLWLADWHHRQGDGEKSRVLLEEAVGHLQEGLAADEGSRLARVQCARACVELGIRSYEKGVLDGAEKALLKAQEVLGMDDDTDESSEGANLGDEAFLFARSEFALGQVLRERGDLQGALERMINSVQTMGELLMDSSPRNQDHALALAESYTILAELVGQHFNAKDSLEAHEQAIPILLELNRLLPEWAEVKYLLARNHGAMAQIERDLGKGTEAVRKKQGAIELINEVLADYPENERYLLLLGRLRSEYAGFLADGRKPSDALAMSKVAAETLRELVEKSGELVKGRVSPEQRERRVQLAQLHGVQGHSYQLMGQKTQAREAFEGAKALWQGLAEAAVPDDMVKQGLAYVEDKLAKLK